LRPVTFRYKDDPEAIKQYGLVAEQVQAIYPELVTRGTDGSIESVRYSMLIPMLLKELQKQSREIARLKARQEGEMNSIARRLAALEQAQAAPVKQIGSLDDEGTGIGKLVTEADAPSY
jgi:hypothetical protein